MAKEFEINFVNNKGYQMGHQETEDMGMAIINIVNYIDYYRRRKVEGIAGLKITIEEIKGD